VVARSADPPWRLRVEVEEPEAVVVSALSAPVSALASGAGQTVGFASAGPAREPAPGAAWELYTLGVDPDLRGSGLADELLASVVGDRPCVVWVLRDSSRARSFYARHGFAPDGTERSHETLGEPEVRLLRDTPPVPARSPLR